MVRLKNFFKNLKISNCNLSQPIVINKCQDNTIFKCILHEKLRKCQIQAEMDSYWLMNASKIFFQSDFAEMNLYWEINVEIIEIWMRLKKVKNIKFKLERNYVDK